MSPSSRPEMAAVLLLVQAGAWALAALGTVPLAVGGERAMWVVAGLTAGLVALALLLAASLGTRQRWARRPAILLEGLCLAGSLLLLVLPIGTPRGLVPFMVDVALPAVLLVLLLGRGGRQAFMQS